MQIKNEIGFDCTKEIETACNQILYQIQHLKGFDDDLVFQIIKEVEHILNAINNDTLQKMKILLNRRKNNDFKI